MKKWNFSFLLLVLPLLTVLVAVNPSGVAVFDGETVSYVSWMVTVPESTLGWCAPLAALMNYAVFALAVFYLLLKKPWCLRGIFAIAFAAGCIAALPVVMQTEVKVVPNAFGAILLMAQSLAAKLMLKGTGEAETKKPEGQRLGLH